MLFFDLPAAIPPPDETDRSYQEIRSGQHIQNAQVQTFALRTPIFEIALSRNTAHGTLGLYLEDEHEENEHQEQDFMIAHI